MAEASQDKRYVRKVDHRIQNPCWEEQRLSYKCMGEKGYDSCFAYFSNYRHCRRFWDKVISDRKKKGIKPTLPPLDERADIKAEYLKSHGK